jgi:hypothetical protein
MTIERMRDACDSTSAVGVIGNVPGPKPDENSGTPEGEDSSRAWPRTLSASWPTATRLGLCYRWPESMATYPIRWKWLPAPLGVSEIGHRVDLVDVGATIANVPKSLDWV